MNCVSKSSQKQSALRSNKSRIKWIHCKITNAISHILEKEKASSVLVNPHHSKAMQEMVNTVRRMLWVNKIQWSESPWSPGFYYRNAFWTVSSSFPYQFNVQTSNCPHLYEQIWSKSFDLSIPFYDMCHVLIKLMFWLSALNWYEKSALRKMQTNTLNIKHISLDLIAHVFASNSYADLFSSDTWRSKHVSTTTN